VAPTLRIFPSYAVRVIVSLALLVVVRLSHRAISAFVSGVNLGRHGMIGAGNAPFSMTGKALIIGFRGIGSTVTLMMGGQWLWRWLKVCAVLLSDQFFTCSRLARINTLHSVPAISSHIANSFALEGIAPIIPLSLCAEALIFLFFLRCEKYVTVWSL